MEFDRQWLAHPEQLQETLRQVFLVWQDSIYSQPFLSRAFVPFTQKTSLQLLRTEYEILPVHEIILPIEIPVDTVLNSSALGTNGAQVTVKTPAELSNNPLIKIEPLGEWQQTSLCELQFFPCQWRELEQEFRFYFHIEVRLNFDLSAPLAQFGGENFSPAIANQFDRMILNHASWRILRQQVKRPRSKTSTPAPQIASNPVCNFIISQDGWYRLSYAEFKKAGVPVDQIDARIVQLFCKGKEVPIYFPGDQDHRFDPDDAIEFWGELNRNTEFPQAEDIYYDPFFLNGVYQLTWGQQPGLRYGSQFNLSPVNAGSVEQPNYFVRNIHLEKDQSYDRLGWATTGDVRDHWFYNSSLGNGELQHYSFDLPKSYPYALEPIRLRIWLHGRTFGMHRIEAYLNQHFVGEGEWYGPEKFLLQTQVEDVGGAILSADQHTLTLINRSSDSLDYVLFNWSELEYAQSFSAKGNFLQFNPPPQRPAVLLRFRLQNFSSSPVEVFKLGAYRILNLETTTSKDSLNNIFYQVQFQDECVSGQEQFIALTPDKKLSVDTLYIYQGNSDLTATDNQADYLIIAPEQFARLAKMQEFIDRRMQTFRVKLATVEDIYQQFGFGIPGPLGIKRFITYTRQHWRQPTPRFVLLVGDGNYFTRSSFWQRENLLPVYQYQTYKFGAAASDMWYVIDGEDGLLPELNIGRWPVRSEEELATVIDKTLRYEQATSAVDWQNRLLMIVGNGGTFVTQTDEMNQQLVPAPFFIDRLHSTSPTDPYYGNTERLVQRWNAGVAYINFLGHGGGAVWSDNLLFRFEDVAKLENQERLPFVTSMTCFTAAFDAPANEVSSLGEALLLHDQGGVVSLFGATGVGWIWNDYYLLREILAVMFTSPQATVGEIVTLGKINYVRKYYTPQVSSMVHQYNLLGDPGLVLRLPWQEIKLSMPAKNYSGGDSLSCQVRLPVTSGQMIFELQDTQGLTLLEVEQPITSSESSIRLVVPPTAQPGQYWLKVFGVSEDYGWFGHGAAPLTVNQLTVARVWLEPSSPTAQDSIHIFAQCLGSQSLDSIRVFFVFNRTAMDSLVMPRFNQEQGVYGLVLPPGFAAAGEQISYYISLQSGQRLKKSDWQILRIYQNPDFEIVQQSLRLQSLNNELFLVVQIRNRSDFCVDGLKVDFSSKAETDSDFVLLGCDTLQMTSYQFAVAKVAWHHSFGNFRFRIQLDPEQQFADQNLVDNTLEETIFADQVKITQAILQSGTLQGSLPPDINFQISLPPTTLGKVLRLAWTDEIATAQVGLQLCQLQSWSKPIFFVGFQDEEDNRLSSAQFDFVLDSLNWAGTMADSQIALYHYYASEQRWAKVIDQNRSDQVWQSRVNGLGYFAWFRSQDTESPRISVMSQNNGFYDGGYVQPNPQFTIRVEDANGAHPNIAYLRMLMNGQPIFTTDCAGRGNYQNGTQFVQLELPALYGENSFQVRGFDCSGNQSEPVTVKFQVAAEIDLLILGNYPNPFVEQTVFCYELTHSVQELELKIFTTSGKLARCFQPAEIVEDANPMEVGYHEIQWDGLDDMGREIANGVYFYQFIAKGEKKTIKKIGKLARIQ